MAFSATFIKRKTFFCFFHHSYIFHSVLKSIINGVLFYKFLVDERTTKRTLFFRKKFFKNFLVQRICFLPHLARINWYKTQCSKIEKSAITNINGRGCTIISNTVINLFWKLFLIYYLVGPIWGTPHLIFFVFYKKILYIFIIFQAKKIPVWYFFQF